MLSSIPKHHAVAWLHTHCGVAGYRLSGPVHRGSISGYENVREIFGIGTQVGCY